MEFHDDWLFGIDWFQYEMMYPVERKSPYINRFMEINMLQMLLKERLKKMEPFVLNEFWKKKTVEQENWNRKWETFRNQLAAEYCQCSYDQHGRIVDIRSDENDIVGTAGKHRKLRSKDEPKCEKEDERDKEDQIKTIGNFYDKMKHLLDSHFKHKQIAYELYIGLREETKEKEISNQKMLRILEKLAKRVVKSEDEEMDIPKMEKFDLLLIINSMTSVIPGDKYVKYRIDGMMNLECERNELSKREQNQDFDNYLFQKVSLAVLGRMIIEILEE